MLKGIPATDDWYFRLIWITFLKAVSNAHIAHPEMRENVGAAGTGCPTVKFF